MTVHADQDKIARIQRFRHELGGQFPRYALSIVAYNDRRTLEKVLQRIPGEIYDLIDEIFIFDDQSSDGTFQQGRELIAREHWEKVHIYQNPVSFLYGGNQKLVFEYAISKGYDFVILMHADGKYAPEYLPDLILPTLTDGVQVVLGSRVLGRLNPENVHVPLHKWWGMRTLSFFQGFLLGQRLSEFHCGYRLYGARFLRQIAFSLNSDDYHFDTQILIQAHLLREPVTEVAVPLYSSNEMRGKRSYAYAWCSFWSIVQFRLHQAGFTIRERYKPLLPVRYAFKDFSHSSHRRIIEMVHPGDRVLDLGCGDGTLAGRIKSRGCHVTGLDLLAPDQISASLDRYVQWDLADERALPFGREFDCIVLGDIVEHVVDGAGLLMRVRKVLKENGRLIISTPNIALWVYRFKLLLGRFNYEDLGIMDRTHVHFYTLSTLVDDLHLTGYNVIAKSYTSLPFPLLITLKQLAGVAQLLNHGYYGLVRLWPRVFAYQLVITARIRRLEWQEMRRLPMRLQPPHPHLRHETSKARN